MKEFEHIEEQQVADCPLVKIISRGSLHYLETACTNPTTEEEDEQQEKGKSVINQPMYLVVRSLKREN